MLDSLTSRLTGILDRLRGFGRLTEENIQEALREVRVALLEADVNFKVVKAFVERVRVKAVGQDVLQSLTPGQQVVKVVRDELVELLGGSGHRLAMAPHPPTVVMLVGLQGSGKTTSAAKLARHFQKQGLHPLLAAADVYRPAAIDQLKTLGTQLGVPVVGEADRRPVDICSTARDEAARRGLSPLILDTAGRLHIDEEMLEELRAIKKSVGPHHVLLVVDAMTGQDAVTVAEKFNAAIGIDAVILTKMDGDARGGAALSVREVTGRPIAFVGVGEKTDALEPFHPDRLAQRILGMGDVLSLVEEVERKVDQEKAQKLAQKVMKGKRFDLEDMRDQLEQMNNMGGLAGLMDKLPGVSGLPDSVKSKVGDGEIKRMVAIIGSMTRKERRHPDLLNGSRRARVAKGSGTQPADVNRLLKQYMQMEKMMSKLSRGGGKGLLRQMSGALKGMGGMGGMGGLPPR
ncbi:MAG TPA: signal recognition particle protein [Rhodanobacter sp.]